MIFFELNYLAVLTAAVIYMGIAALWYSPLMFSRLWMEENDLDRADIEERGMFPALGWAFLAAAILALGLSVLIRIAAVENWFTGALMGLFAGLLISAPAALPVYVFENRSLKLFVINEGMPVVALLIMGAVLGGWHP